MKLGREFRTEMNPTGDVGQEKQMTNETLDAVFEHGALHLVKPPRIPLREGQRVRLIIQADESPDAILALAADVYTGLSPQDVAEVEQIALERRDFFGKQV
jgi:hypothetical protein